MARAAAVSRGARPVARRVDLLQSAELNVYPYRCVVVRNRNATCTACAEACTSGAIGIEDGEVSVEPDRCVGCGTCATVCPTCALEARNPVDAQLVSAARRACRAAGGQAVVACSAAWDARAGEVDAERAVRVVCLGRVEESLLVGLAADGAHRIVLVHGDCATCPRAAGIATCERVCATVEALLEAWCAPTVVELASEFPAAVLGARKSAAGDAAPRTDVPARSSATACGGEDAPARLDVPACPDAPACSDAPTPMAAGARVVSSAPACPDALVPLNADTCMGGSAPACPDAPVPLNAEGRTVSAAPAVRLKAMADGTLPHFVPDRRERLLDALAELGEPDDVALETRLWGRVDIDASRCKTCLMCATFCPTGAIAAFRDPDGSVGVEHIPADCVKCRCCTDVCPTGALTLREDVPARELVGSTVAGRFVLPPVTDDRGGPHSIIGALRKIIDCDQLYER